MASRSYTSGKSIHEKSLAHKTIHHLAQSNSFSPCTTNLSFDFPGQKRLKLHHAPTFRNHFFFLSFPRETFTNDADFRHIWEAMRHVWPEAHWPGQDHLSGIESRL
jgi:hypothetical protein